jgi:general secretion pathway protein C
VPARVEVPSQEPKPRALFTPEELTRGLRPLGNGTYVLARALLLKALTNPGGAASGAHFRLAEREGRSLGMEVRGVRDGSVLSRMGLRSGDVVKSVNGIDVSNPLGLLDLLRTTRNVETVTLTILHEGKERALRYLIE